MIKLYKSLYQLLYTNENIPKIIPTDDTMAVKLYPEYEKFYNKLFWCELQKLKYGFIKPSIYPVVIKPYKNLKGMSIDFKIIKTSKEFKLKDNQFWMELLSGEHLCIDLFILNGKIVLYTILKSYSGVGGTFKYHESLPNRKLSLKIINIIHRYFSNYTGIINCETINNIIIDFHLRLNGDFYLYNNNIVEEIKNLYFNHQWNVKNYTVPKKYLIPIFIDKNLNFKVNIKKVKNILIKYNCNNIQYNDIYSELQSPGGSRIFMYDVNNLKDGIASKNEILLLFNKKNNYKTIILIIILLFIISIK